MAPDRSHAPSDKTRNPPPPPPKAQCIHECGVVCDCALALVNAPTPVCVCCLFACGDGSCMCLCACASVCFRLALALSVFGPKSVALHGSWTICGSVSESRPNCKHRKSQSQVGANRSIDTSICIAKRLKQTSTCRRPSGGDDMHKNASTHPYPRMTRHSAKQAGVQSVFELHREINLQAQRQTRSKANTRDRHRHRPRQPETDTDQTM